MGTIRISEADAERDFAGLMERVRAGAEVIIESGPAQLAVLRALSPARRSISESISLAEARSKQLGYKPVMDAAFAADLEEIIRNRKPRDTSEWDKSSTPAFSLQANGTAKRSKISFAGRRPFTAK